jgi:hypothetical protein
VRVVGPQSNRESTPFMIAVSASDVDVKLAPKYTLFAMYSLG